ncbi:MAG: tRNA guanosine(34) transglycosylase Tgt [Anaerolineae bacterium]
MTNEGQAPRLLHLAHGDLELPIFLPDATRAVVRAVDSRDLENCGITGLVMSTFHLMQSPGSSTIQKLGGLHSFTNWPHPIISDSGGFQIYSLVRQNDKYGSLSDKGMVFRDEAGEKHNLTPEKSVQLQLSYGADVVYCLDDPTHVDESDAAQTEAVERTIKWARRCREEFDRITAQKKYAEGQRPLLFAVVQGGGLLDLRRQCAEALLEIGFDGYGFGGWPLDAEGNLLSDIIAYTRRLIPREFPMHALGIGHPYNVLHAARQGYDIFDSALPTRDARSGRLYRLKMPLQQITFASPENWFANVYIQDKKYIKEEAHICRYSDNDVNQHYSLAYLHHLYKINDTLYMRLATLHNLSFMSALMARIRELIHG